MREFWVESQGARLFAIEDGSGPVVIMLHGALANHLAALPFLTPLGEHYRIVAPDLRGSGKSWCGASLTFDQLVDDVDKGYDDERPSQRAQREQHPIADQAGGPCAPSSAGASAGARTRPLARCLCFFAGGWSRPPQCEPCPPGHGAEA